MIVKVFSTNTTSLRHEFTFFRNYFLENYFEYMIGILRRTKNLLVSTLSNVTVNTDFRNILALAVLENQINLRPI